MNPFFFTDFYKFFHIFQYPKGVKQIWTNWTPRSTRVEGKHRVVNAGLTYLAKKYLIEAFNRDFFGAPKDCVIREYRNICNQCLGVKDASSEHVEALWNLGYLPIKIYSLPEGFTVPLRVPPIVITNTLPEFFWLPNYFETLFSAIMWEISTSATTAQRYRKVMTKWAKEGGEKDLSFIDWQGHDFSMRGMGGIEDSILSGLGHLMCFNGTDTVPAIMAARDYYGAPLSCGGSVNATEHSVMCAGGQNGEFETFKRLLTEVHPAGILSIVSDTWDLWKVLTEFVPALKETILKRDGKMVIRPDSGDPVKIICGDQQAKEKNVGLGTLRLLAEAMGTVKGGGDLPMIDHAGAIYGDSITVERADTILGRMVQELKISPFNMVFGIGSYTYRYVTRDTYGWAMKATAARLADGSIMPMFKKPVTDDGTKFSAKGLLAVYRTQESTEERPDYFLVEEATEEHLDNCAYEVVFENSELLIDPPFDVIRKRVRA